MCGDVAFYGRGFARPTPSPALGTHDARRWLWWYIQITDDHRIISYHIISYHIISYHIISYHSHSAKSHRNSHKLYKTSLFLYHIYYIHRFTSCEAPHHVRLYTIYHTVDIRSYCIRSYLISDLWDHIFFISFWPSICHLDSSLRTCTCSEICPNGHEFDRLGYRGAGPQSKCFNLLNKQLQMLETKVVSNFVFHMLVDLFLLKLDHISLKIIFCTKESCDPERMSLLNFRPRGTGRHHTRTEENEHGPYVFFFSIQQRLGIVTRSSLFSPRNELPWVEPAFNKPEQEGFSFFLYQFETTPTISGSFCRLQHVVCQVPYYLGLILGDAVVAFRVLRLMRVVRLLKWLGAAKINGTAGSKQKLRSVKKKHKPHGLIFFFFNLRSLC